MKISTNPNRHRNKFRKIPNQRQPTTKAKLTLPFLMLIFTIDLSLSCYHGICVNDWILWCCRLHFTDVRVKCYWSTPQRCYHLPCLLRWLLICFCDINLCVQIQLLIFLIDNFESTAYLNDSLVELCKHNDDLYKQTRWSVCLHNTKNFQHIQNYNHGNGTINSFLISIHLPSIQYWSRKKKLMQYFSSNKFTGKQCFTCLVVVIALSAIENWLHPQHICRK